jgi:long-chain fatty acid transport protein
LTIRRGSDSLSPSNLSLRTHPIPDRLLKKTLCVVLVGTLLLLLGSGQAWAGGVSFTEQGAAASGKGNAFTGEANDPSAIFYNPAGITQLPGTQLMIGTSIVKLDSTFRSSTSGESTELQDQFPIIPHFYITHRFKQWDERVSIGLGIYTPFGIVVDWPDNWQGRFNTTDARLRVTIYNPTVAYQATPNLSVAVGIRIADAGAQFEQKFDIGFGESKVRVQELEANPVGWNVGLLYHLKEISTSVGLQFRSELQARFDGDADFTGPSGPPMFENTRFHTSVKLPPQLILGVSTKVIPRWTINADIEWEGWRTVGSLPKSFDTTAGSLVDQSNLNQRGLRDWKNSYVFRLGAEYAATDRIALRGGFFYDQTPIPDHTFDPTIPNADLYALTTGLGYRWEATSVDLAYLFGFYEKRAINASTSDPNNLAGTTTIGSYSTTAQVLVLSVTHRF